jgi:hypothetical protein
MTYQKRGEGEVVQADICIVAQGDFMPSGATLGPVEVEKIGRPGAVRAHLGESIIKIDDDRSGI